jgi:DNA mismatch repair protein MutS2
LARFLDAVAAVRGLAVHAVFAEVGLPAWHENLWAALAPGRVAPRTFYLADAFDGELATARAGAAAARTHFDAERSRLSARVAAYAGVDHLRDGEFVLMRDRATTPLPPEVRVLREGTTYYLCELALDEAARGALAQLDVADARVAELEDSVRARLSAVVLAASVDVDNATHALGALDAFVARARFAQRYDACLPEISDDALLECSDARFLPLAESLKQRGHRYVPISLSLDGVGVLTGPNMGGKSAALRTCGFVAACAVLGVPVPAASARVGFFGEIAWIGLDGGAEASSLLSSFGREVAQLRDFLARERARPLVLIDEFARTTSPREGRALLVALLERLAEHGAVGLAATHLWRIAEDAHRPHYAVRGLRELPVRTDDGLDLDAAIDRIASVMDYRVARVEAGAAPRADAVALADVLGLAPGLIARARELL